MNIIETLPHQATRAAMLPPIAVSLGDPAGVGPELIAECWARRHESRLLPFFVVGGAHIIVAAAQTRGLSLPIATITRPEDSLAVFPQALPILPIAADTLATADYHPGIPDRKGAALALASLNTAIQLAVSGRAAALVTAPIAKALLAEAGFTHPGQTECVAAACGIPPEDAVMMLAAPSLRTVPLTVHVALADVPRLLTQELIIRRARITAAALARDFGLTQARLAVAALNPHAGESGRMGTEDARIITPAITVLAAEGLDISGPHPADALFTPRARATYDVALCAYHDQALIPLKTLDFDEGVNVTLGLPVIRTSPDHGTAFAIAGRHRAEPGAMLAALRMAGDCARRRAV